MMDAAIELISGRFSQYAVEALLATGVDVEALCRKARIPYEPLRSRTATVAHGSIARLWAEAVEVTGDGDLGLHAVERMPLIANDLFLHLVSSSETLGAGVDRGIHFFRLAGSTHHLEVIRQPDATVWQSVSWQQDHSAWVEFRFGLYRRLAALVTRREIYPRRVTFKHPERGGPRDLYARVFGCPVSFSEAEHTMVWPTETMMLPIPTACDETVRALEKAAAAAAAGPATSDIERDVRHLVSVSISDARLSQATVARALRLSERTLQRRLAEAGCTFRELLNDVRRRHALDLVVSTSLAVDEMARAVGYTSVRSLTRAMKRWTGSTVSELRADSDRPDA